MKKQMIHFLPIVVFMSYSAMVLAGNVCVYSPGNVVCGIGTVDNVSEQGSATLNGTTVTGSVAVNGTFRAESANINHGNINGSVFMNNTAIQNSFNINGSTSINHSTFKGGFIINGLLTATKSTFNTLEIGSSQTTFTDSRTKDIHVLRDNYREKVYLNGNTIVDGNIVFDSGNGEVIENGGTVTGKVIGGKITN